MGSDSSNKSGGYSLVYLHVQILRLKILSFKSCDSLLFSNLFQRDCLYVLLEDNQKGKSGELIDHGFDLLLP
ncbi:hypothetical protein IGI04_023476, partial [Brassica rapa subsp. trilocularis]